MALVSIECQAGVIATIFCVIVHWRSPWFHANELVPPPTSPKIAAFLPAVSEIVAHRFRPLVQLLPVPSHDIVRHAKAFRGRRSEQRFRHLPRRCIGLERSKGDEGRRFRFVFFPLSVGGAVVRFETEHQFLGEVWDGGEDSEISQAHVFHFDQGIILHPIVARGPFVEFVVSSNNETDSVQIAKNVGISIRSSTVTQTSQTGQQSRHQRFPLLVNPIHSIGGSVQFRNGVHGRCTL
mmetsp:Transcript_2426/g.5042  ORF Transcript_2426/g.5042 Transcript_2426/m.5042 type:complete len:237 (+) Transcript_2426:157-867(+)